MLHLQKHWLPYTFIMTCFLFATACDLFIIFNGEKVAALFSELINSCFIFQVDGSKWVWISLIFSLITLLIGLAFKTIMYCLRITVEEWELNAYLTMSTTQFLHENLKHIRTNYLLPRVAAGLFAIQLYGITAAYLHILFPTIIALTINNFALHWNLRLAVLLRKIKGKLATEAHHKSGNEERTS